MERLDADLPAGGEQYGKEALDLARHIFQTPGRRCEVIVQALDDPPYPVPEHDNSDWLVR